MKNVRRLFAILVFVGMSLMANAQEGAWSGEIEVQGMKLPLRKKLQLSLHRY